MNNKYQENIGQGNVDFAKSNKLFLYIGLIAIAGFLVYGNSLYGQFVWDDQRLVQENHQIRNWGNLIEIFTTSLRSPLSEQTPVFRPMQTFTYLIDYSAWKVNVVGYHLTNVMLHIGCALALFWLTQILFARAALSFLTALFFVVHPIHTEAVAYISGRADPLAGFLMLLSFCLYLKSLNRANALRLGLMCLSYLGALLSRESALILPALILLFHLAFKKPVTRKIFAALLGTIMLYIFWRWSVLHGVNSALSNPTTLWQRLPGVFASLAEYARLMVLPYGLHMEYGGILFSWHNPRIYWGIGVLLGLLTLARSKRDNCLIIFSIGWFFVALFPMMNIIPINSYMAEHWLYVPFMGYAWLMACSILYLFSNSRMRIFAILFGSGLIIYYGSMTIRQNTHWRDPIEFYKHTLQYNPQSARLYTNLASEFLKADKEADLLGLLKTAIAIEPNNPVAYNSLGNAYKGLGRIDDALSQYEQSIALNPHYVGPHYNLGVIYYDVLHDDKKAIEHLKGAIAIDPTFYKAYHKLGSIYIHQGQKNKAIELLKRAVEVNRDDANIYHSLAYTYYQMGDVDEAAWYFHKTIEVNPHHAEAYKNLAIIHYKKGEYRQAIEFADKSASLGHWNANLMKALAPHRQ